jgi:hypothetical protein
MAVEFVRAKNSETGAVASLPVTALRYMPNWKQVDGPPPTRPKSNRTPPPVPPADGEQSQQPDAADAASTEQE